MINDRRIIPAILIISLFLSSGCNALTSLVKRERTVPKQESRTYRIVPLRDLENQEIVYFTFIIEDETYFDILNKESRAKAPILIQTRRHIGFGYSATEKEQKAFIRIVFPWWN